jgi:hypothetical protein
MMFNATINNIVVILLRSVLFVEDIFLLLQIFYSQEWVVLDYRRFFFCETLHDLNFTLTIVSCYRNAFQGRHKNVVGLNRLMASQPYHSL